MCLDPREEVSIIGVEDVGNAGLTEQSDRSPIRVVSQGVERTDIEGEDGTVRVLDGEDMRGSVTTVVTLHDSINLSRVMLSICIDLYG